MPKIFITGSNTTKGFVTGSGYLNNPARVLIREEDDRLGKYPTTKRMGTEDRLGNVSASPFRDNGQIFEKTIFDNFDHEIKNFVNSFRAVPSSSRWITSGTEKIRKDITASNLAGSPVGAFTFEGNGNSDGRWLKTKSNVLNPTVQIEVYQGPYDQSVLGLGLSQGKPTDILKIQTSINGSSDWQDVFINSYNVTNQSFLDKENGYLKPFVEFQNAILQGNQSNPGLLGFSQNTPKDRPVCIVNLSMREFNNHGNNKFYIRIIQESISDSNKKTWAIGKIKIVSRDQYLTYPTLTSNSSGGQLLKNKLLSSPNFLNDQIQANSSPIKGNIKYNTENVESLKPYNESISVDRSIFFNEGIDRQLYEGFSSNLLSKTKFEIDLSPSSPTEFGHVTPLSVPSSQAMGSSSTFDTSENGQQYMVYWNNVNKRWEKRGRPFNINNTTSPTGLTFLEFLSQSCLGFSGITYHLGSNQNNTLIQNARLLSRDFYAGAYKPITSAGFPFSGQYHATSSQYIVAKDIGITKPFLLEKCSIDFDVNLRIAKATTGPYVTIMSYGENDNPKTSKVIYSVGNIRRINIPSFFLLRQFRDNFSKKITVSYSTGSTAPSNGRLEYNVTIPGNYYLNSGSNESTYVTDSRELITYGQFSYFLTASGGLTYGSNYTSIYPEDLIDRGLKGDTNIIKEYGTGIDDVTKESYIMSESIKINFPVRNCSQFPDRFTTQVYDQSTGETVTQRASRGVIMGKRIGTGTESDLKYPRSLFNGVGSQDLGGTIHIPAPTIPNTTLAYQKRVAKAETLVKDSAYLIMPDDKLIFGWQFPPSSRAGQRNPGSSDQANREGMELIGKSKLVLYGSQVKDNKEIHEGLNQNLSSNNINEVIGNDLVTDQFQNATRGQLSGSFRAQYALATEPGTSNYTSFGKNIFTFEGLLLAPKQRSMLTSNIAKNRIGVDNIDIIQSDYFDQFQLASIEGFSLCSDSSRVFSDAVDKTGTYLNDSSYGTSQAYFIYVASTALANNARTTGSPKYYFNASRFGQYADFYQQGRDSKFKSRITERVTNENKKPAIQIQFVKSERGESGLEIREFFKIRASEIDGTAETQYQSSNISLFATSSLPFFDDNVAINRNYEATAGIIVE